MRVSGGKAGGVALRVAKGAAHRPAMDRLRQAIFSSLGEAIIGARVCDLFAGTGSYGLEALSRGAAHTTFVETNRLACATIRQNLGIVAKSMGVEQLDGEVQPTDATRWRSGEAGSFDIAFVDPPYEQIESMSPAVFETLSLALGPNGIIVFEMPGSARLHAGGWTLRKRLGKGRSQATACIYVRAHS